MAVTERNKERRGKSQTEQKGYDPELEVVLSASLDILIKHGPHLIDTLSNNNNIRIHVNVTYIKQNYREMCTDQSHQMFMSARSNDTAASYLIRAQDWN